MSVLSFVLLAIAAWTALSVVAHARVAPEHAHLVGGEDRGGVEHEPLEHDAEVAGAAER